MSVIPELSERDALMVEDVQLDFCPGGALPVEEGDQVVEVINKWTEAALSGGAALYFSRDWHPRTHPSFQDQGGLWPAHCVQDSEGAAFHPDLNVPETSVIVTKGTRFDRDQYSSFDETGLAAEMRRRGVKHIWIGGLALDFCVRATTLDARKEGFDVSLILDATRHIAPESGAEALEEMRRAGVRVLE